MTVNGSQTTTAFASADVAGNGSTVFYYDICYKKGTGLVTPINGTASYQMLTPQTDIWTPISTGAATKLAAGTYSIGMCVKNPTPIAVASDFVKGWVLVTN